MTLLAQAQMGQAQTGQAQTGQVQMGQSQTGATLPGPTQGPPVFTPKFPPASPGLPAPAPAAAPPPAQPAIVQPAPLPAQPLIAQPGPLPIPVPPGMPGWTVPALVVGIGLILGVLALVLWRRAHRIDEEEVLRVLAIDPESAGTEHVEFPPLDLHQPIFGEAAWRAIRTHAEDAHYLHAVEVVRERYGDSGHPMTLPNLLRTTMTEGRVGFREAMLRLADLADEDDRDRGWSGPVLDETGAPIEPEAEEAEPPAPDTQRPGSPAVGGGRIFDVDDAPEPGPEGAGTWADPPGPGTADAGDPGGPGTADAGSPAAADWIVDLTRPIGAEQWGVILLHAEGEGYLDAAQAVQARFRNVIDRMLLPNTLRRLMEVDGLDFAAAMTRAAQDDPTRPRRRGEGA